MIRANSKLWHGGAPIALMLGAIPFAAAPAAAQRTLDRVDPTRVVEDAPRGERPAAELPPIAATPPAAAPAVVAAPAVTIGAITLSGLRVLKPSDFADLIETYVGRTLSPAALSGVADAVAERMRARGYVLASASIPPQPLVAGVLRIEVDEGAIDGVRVRGADNAAVERALAPLVGTGPVTLAALERRLLIAGDVDGLWIRRSRLVREDGRNILEVDLGTDRLVATAGIDNWGSRPIGPVQADLTVSLTQLAAADDVVTFTALVTPTQPSELGFVRGRYGKRISSDGTEVSISGSYSNTRPGAYLLDRDIEGRSWSARLDMLHPLVRQRAASLWLLASLGVRDVRQDRADLLARRDRLTVARAGLNGFADVAGGRLRASALLSRGLDWFDATRAGDPFASRSDADGTFTTLALSASWTTPIVPDVSAQIAVATQVADRPLLVSEEVGLGGGEFLRGYDYSERSGDRGTMVSGEVRWAVAPRVGPVADPLLYAFVDGGRVTNLDGGFGSGSLFSTGAGLRSTIAKLLSADVGVAVPLSGERYDSGDADPVVNFRLTRRF